jgi:prolyl 4-hydroxylase
MTDHASLAQRELAAGNTTGAIAAAEAGAARDEAATLALLAGWRLAGHPVARDLVAARGLLRRAAVAGDEWATLAEIALTANGSGGATDWTGALDLLREAALRFEEAAHHLALIEAMDLAADGSPRHKPVAGPIGTNPRVLLHRGFLSAAECAHIARSAQDLLEPSSVFDPASGRHIAHPIRTSSAATIGPTRESLAVRAILGRIAALTGLPTDHGEPLSVLHYAPGQQYRMHMDAIPGASNQRVATVLLFLNDAYEGGETVFEASGLAVRGRAGDALLFANTLPNGSPDPQSRHAGAPVRTGAKWLATRWIRTRPYDVWNGG